MHSLAVKIISLVSLFALTFASGVIPLKLRSGRGSNDVDRRQESRDRRRRQLISLGTCFAGGAFFASSMLGLLPVVQREFKDLLAEARIKTEFPVPEFSVSVGFFLILIVEQIIHVLKEKPVKCHSEVCSEDSRSPLLGKSFAAKVTFSGASFVKHGKKENITERENSERESGESDDDEIVNLHRHHHHRDGDAGDFDHTSIENHVNQNPRGYQSPHTHPDDHGNDHEDFAHNHHNDPHDPSNDHKDFDHHHNHHRDGDTNDLHHDHTSIGNQVNQNPGGYQSSHALQDEHDKDHKEDSDHHLAHHHDYHKDGDASDLDHSSTDNHINQNPGGYQSQHTHPDDHRNDHEDFDHHHDHHSGDAGDLDHLSIDNHVNQNPGDYQSSHTHSDDHNDHEEDSHHHDHCIFENTSTKHHNERHYLRSYLLLIALSIHALFEGLAVGLFQNIDNMVELLAPLIIHKCILGFSMGVNLVQHCFPSFMIVKSSFLFAAMSPIGLGIGILMLSFTSAELGHIFSAIFQAIATGTFLYVTFFEIFFHELNSGECHKLLKAFMMVLGFGLIAVIQFFNTKISSD